MKRLSILLVEFLILNVCAMGQTVNPSSFVPKLTLRAYKADTTRRADSLKYGSSYYMADFPISLVSESLGVKLPLHAPADSARRADSLGRNPWTAYFRSDVPDTMIRLTARATAPDTLAGGPAGAGTYIAWQAVSGTAAAIANYGAGNGYINTNFSQIAPFSNWDNYSKGYPMMKMTVCDTPSAPGALIYLDDGGFKFVNGTELQLARVTRSGNIGYGVYVDSGNGSYYDVGNNGRGIYAELNNTSDAGSTGMLILQNNTAGALGRPLVIYYQGNPNIPAITVSGTNEYADSTMIYRWGAIADSFRARSGYYGTLHGTADSLGGNPWTAYIRSNVADTVSGAITFTNGISTNQFTQTKLNSGFMPFHSLQTLASNWTKSVLISIVSLTTGNIHFWLPDEISAIKAHGLFSTITLDSIHFLGIGKSTSDSITFSMRMYTPESYKQTGTTYATTAFSTLVMPTSKDWIKFTVGKNVASFNGDSTAVYNVTSKIIAADTCMLQGYKAYYTIAP